jgi:hypothetical protein
VGRSNKARIVTGVTKRKTSAAISSSSPLGLMALHLLAQSRKSGRNGVVFLTENETRAERLGAIIHALESSCNVLVFPRLRPTQFNYPVDILGKWHGTKYRFIQRYRSGFPENLGEGFDAPFARLDWISRNRFDIRWHRHTGEWFCLYHAGLQQFHRSAVPQHMR